MMLKIPEHLATGANIIAKERMNMERLKELITPDVTT
jgi:hypothetical protein